jgi:hypothetical protein
MTLSEAKARMVAPLVALAVICTGCGALVTAGQMSDQLSDTAVITRVPNMCLLLPRDLRTQPIVGTESSADVRTDESLGSHTCVWPATVPARAEIRVEIIVNDQPAEAAAREQLFNFVDYRTDTKSGRVFGLIPYGDNLACVQAWNPSDVQYLGVMKEGNVITKVAIQTRRTAAPQDLRAIAGDVSGPLRTILRVVDAAINRPPNVFKDPSGDLPKQLTPAQREVAPDWMARLCREKQAPPVFN